MSNEFNSESDDCNVICPYCGYSYQPEAAEYSETVREEDCDKCKKTYVVHQAFEVTHHTATKE